MTMETRELRFTQQVRVSYRILEMNLVYEHALPLVKSDRRNNAYAEYRAASGPVYLFERCTRNVTAR